MTNASELQIPAQVAECFSDARAYVGKAIDELSDLVSNMEDARDNLQDHFAGSEQVEALEIGIDSVDELVSSLDQLDWPGDIPASELPPPVQVASAPLVTRGSRKGSPKRLSVRQQRQLTLDVVSDWLTAANDALAELDFMYEDLDEDLVDILDSFRGGLQDHSVDDVELPRPGLT